MKTPREILLKRHAAAGEQLDAIRARFVKDLRRAASRSRTPENAGWPGWVELFWSLRGHVAALAGAWVLIAFLSSQNAGDQPFFASTQGRPEPRELLLMARENRIQMRELLKLEPSEAPAPAARPRSQVEPDGRSAWCPEPTLLTRNPYEQLA